MVHSARVGILSRNRQTPGERVDAVLAGADVQASLSSVTDPSTFPIASPWSTSDNMQRLVFEDVFGTNIPINTRAAAMRLGAVAAARNKIVSAISRMPLVQKRAGVVVTPTPSWMYDGSDGTPPQLTIADTVDDLIFYGWSCWWRTNRADGFPLRRGRINWGDWRFNQDMRVEVNGTVVADNSVIVIRGLHEGILTYGRDVLDDARFLYKTVRSRLLNPAPGVDLHQVDGADLTETEIDDLIARWAAARQGANAGVSFTNKYIEANEMGLGGDGQLLIEARNAAAVELARIVGVDASQVDATAPKASLNYETTTGRNQEFVDFDLALYMTPITARLSMDDVTPHGTNVDFDRSDFTAPAPSPTGPALED